MYSLIDIRAGGGKVLGCVLTGHAHHVPNLICRFPGATPKCYYCYDGADSASQADAAARPSNVHPPQA